MANNEYLPFATNVSPNVIDQATYAALVARGNGFSSGLAKSAEANKVWRQANTIASMIGQFIADMALLDALDNGDIPTLEARFKLALVNTTTRRTIVTTDMTIYVDPVAGNDANNGLTSGTAFRTIQAAINAVYYTYDWNSHNCVILLAHGTYTYSVSGGNQCTFWGMPFGMRPFGLTLRGDGLAQDTVIINNVNSNAIGAFGAFINVDGVRITSSGSVWTPTLAQGAGIVADQASRIVLTNVTVDTVSQMQLWAVHGGVIVLSGNNNKFSGTANYGWITQEGGLIYAAGLTVTVTGTYAVAFAYSIEWSTIWATALTWSGAAAGARYNVSLNSVIQTGGGGANYFPGNAAGSAVTGGQYV